jgi:hypothetical protein
MTWQNAINTENEHEVCKVQYDKEKLPVYLLLFILCTTRGFTNSNLPVRSVGYLNWQSFTETITIWKNTEH